MFDIPHYGNFLAAVVVFQLVPGAGTITILNAAARQGVGGGMKAVFGTLSGDFVYMLAAALGLAAVLGAYPGVLESAQWIGAAYLCRLGWKLLRTSRSDRPLESGSGGEGWGCFRQALAVALTNPKVILFFMAFFPLFMNAESGPVSLAMLMLNVTAVSLLYQTFLVLAGNAVARRVSRWKSASVFASRLAGVALIGFGAKLALSNR